MVVVVVVVVVGLAVVVVVVVVVVGFAVLCFKLQGGLERGTKYMMVALLGLMIVLAVNSATLSGAKEGLTFYLLPDFGKITPNVIVGAMNQAFFTLSLGIGSMAIFGSYIGKERSLMGESLNILGLDTFVALMAGLIMGIFSGASYQISGPTGAMSAILISLVAQYGLNGVFIACFISGAILLICGIFKLGGIVSFIPTPVITGFTSGIAIIIAFGQINNLTGLVSEGESTIDKIVSYFSLPQTFNPTSFLIGAAVMVFMFIYPKKLNGIVPSSLVAIILATVANSQNYPNKHNYNSSFDTSSHMPYSNDLNNQTVQQRRY